MKLKKIAECLGCRLTAGADLEISGVAGLEQAKSGELTFLSNPRYTRLVETTKASAIITEKEIERRGLACLLSDNPYLDFARALELFYQSPRPATGIHPTAVVAESAKIGPNASIGPYAIIGQSVVLGRGAVIHSHVAIYEGAEIGDDFLAHSHAVVREFCRLGDRVILQNGVIVGGDGYGFAHKPDGSHYKIVQAGRVVIEDDVEIQAHSCIDRAAVGETRIKRGSKLDNLVQIGHSVEIGENAIVCAQVGIAGSTTVGRNCVLAGQVGLVGHLNVGDNVAITAQSGVPSDVPDDKMISGYPAIDNRRWLRCAAVYNRLPELDKAVRELEKRINELSPAS